MVTGCLRQFSSSSYPTRTHGHFVVFLGELRPLCGQTFLYMFLLGYGIQGSIRVRGSGLQAHVLQCHTEHIQNVAADSVRCYRTVRVHQTSHRANTATASALFYASIVQSVNILPLLCVVGVYELLQR